MTFAPGDVVRVRNGNEAVVLRAPRDGVLMALAIHPTRGAARRFDVALGFSDVVLATRNPLVRCDLAVPLGVDRLERIGALPSATLARIAAVYLRERAVRRAEERLHFMRRRPTEAALALAA